MKNINNCRTLVINCNSAPGHRAHLVLTIEETDPDWLILTETKIDKNVQVSGFYKGIARKDRDRHGGGVLIATQKDFDIGVIEFNYLCYSWLWSNSNLNWTNSTKQNVRSSMHQ